MPTDYERGHLQTEYNKSKAVFLKRSLHEVTSSAYLPNIFLGSMALWMLLDPNSKSQLTVKRMEEFLSARINYKITKFIVKQVLNN